MIWIAAGFAVAGWSVALLLLTLLPARARREATQSALRLRSHVEPYLRRRLQEIHKDAEASDPSQDPPRLVDHLCQLADRLTEHERAQISMGDTLNVAHSDTLPIDTGDILAADAEAQKKK